MSKLVKVGSVADIPPGSAKLVEVERKRIAVFNVGSCYYAIDGRHIELGAVPGAGDDLALERALGERSAPVGARIAPRIVPQREAKPTPTPEQVRENKQKWGLNP